MTHNLTHDQMVKSDGGGVQHMPRLIYFCLILGTQAKPAFPLTPAAIINGCAMTRDEMAKREDAEEVNRIRGNIQSSETVSSALLKALMPYVVYRFLVNSFSSNVRKYIKLKLKNIYIYF